MTRIIGGAAGGRRLKTPGGTGTRPTADRVREALFSSLESVLGSLAGLRFLDLYAGSGAVGLEALSRGADAATFVESDRRAAAVIGDNARLAGLNADVVSSTVTQALRHQPRAPYDVAFLDPPYSTTGTEVTAALTALGEGGWLAEQAVVVIERATRNPAPAWPDRFEADRSRRYGETTLWYGHATSR